MQDGEDNNIDLDITSMDNFIISFSQIGTDHSITNRLTLTVDGRNGSSIYINQTGSNRSYNTGSLYCVQAFFLHLTVTQGNNEIFYTLDNSVHNVVRIDIYWFTRFIHLNKF